MENLAVNHECQRGNVKRCLEVVMMKFWQNKKVLVTGHTGFKGSWLSLWLQLLKAEVIGFALHPPTKPNLFEVADIEQHMTSMIGDIRDLKVLQKALAAHQPEIVIHMAAQPLVRYSYTEPVETYTTNVIGTVNLLESVRQTPSVKVVVNVTTDKCYENQEWHWGYRENDRLGGHDPYSNSKACAELVTAAYRNSYFQHQQIALATARAGNVIGGGDWAKDRLIPDIIRAALEQRPVAIRNPQATRPWQHVLEPLSGYLLLAEKMYDSPDMFNEAWNFGPDDHDIQPVNWITDRVNYYLGHSEAWVRDQNDHPHESNCLKLACAKAKSRLGWQPRWDLEKGLKETINWFQAYHSKKNMRAITLDQIKHFMGTILE